MSTATIEKPRSANSLEAAKASLRAEFESLMEQAPHAVVLKAATLSGGQALAAVLQRTDAGMSIQARNQIALNKLKERAFESLKASCHLLEAADACAILGISKQALAKKGKVGQVLAYTKNHRKFYPDFQFKNNKVESGVAGLVKAIGLDVSDETQVNVLIQFLVQDMDYSNPAQNERIVPRYTLLEDNTAASIIARDFNNRLEMGK